MCQRALRPTAAQVETAVHRPLPSATRSPPTKSPSQELLTPQAREKGEVELMNKQKGRNGKLAYKLDGAIGNIAGPVSFERNITQPIFFFF